MLKIEQNESNFPEDEYSYCFNASEPVRVIMRNDSRHAFTLEDSCYIKPEKKDRKIDWL